jgi:hypothetical protein
MLHSRLEPRFVKHIPDSLDDGVLYISMEYATAAHRCCCGCGEEVVTPFSPRDWKLTFDGETISLWPSIGSWTLPCRSHYVIDHSAVISGSTWNERRISKRVEHVPDLPSDHSEPGEPSETSPTTAPVEEPSSRGFWRTLLKRISRFSG